MITGLCNVARKLRTELTEQYPDIHLSTGISNDVIYLNYTNSQKLFDVLNTVREIRNRYHVYDTYEKCYKTASIITCRDISESYIKIVADFFEEHYQMSKYSTNVTVAVSQWIDSHDLYEPPLLNVKSQINDKVRIMTTVQWKVVKGVLF